MASMLEMLDEGKGCKAIEGGMVTSVRMLLPAGDRTDVLLVVKASKGPESYIGFVGGLDVMTAMLTWLKKEQGAGLAFRADVPWEDRP